MNLLPKNRTEFAEKGYWDTFFQKRGNKAFEWYGEYPELCEYLHNYIKQKDDILIVGCGNSVLGNDLYDVGYRNITSIDISQVAIRQMKNVNDKRRPEMKFIQMDALQTSFQNEQFSVILDKGTLDALMPDDKEQTVAQIKKYFDEMLRVLKIGGRFLCISLLQEHILKTLLDYFPQNDCLFRVIRCHGAENTAEESSMPVFMVICFKFKVLPAKVLELGLGDKMVRVKDENVFASRIQEAQQAAFICSGLKKTGITDGNDDISFELFRDGEKKPRYTIYVVEIPQDRKFCAYAAFLVPQGRECEWLFSTKEGRQKLSAMSKCNRLAIITLHRGQQYENFDLIKEELSSSIKNFAPSTIKNEKIQFLSLGADVGERTVCYKGSSKFSGDYIIEDIVSDNMKYRRLFYMSTQLVIQSEALLKDGKSRTGNSKTSVDTTYLTCGHHFQMSKAVHMVTSKKENPSVIVIGLGGGGLCSFLTKFIPKLNVIGVDIDSDMLDIATKWFGLQLSDKMKVEITDGLEYLKIVANVNDKKHEAILFDVDSKDTSVGMSCPPKEFLADEILDNVCKGLTDDGLFILNVVLRDESLRPNIIDLLKSKFKSMTSYKLEGDLNEVFICSCQEKSVKSFKNTYSQATKEMDNFFQKCSHKNLIGDHGESNCLQFYNDKK